jgi:hypothetical protein
MNVFARHPIPLPRYRTLHIPQSLGRPAFKNVNQLRAISRCSLPDPFERNKLSGWMAD